MTIFWTLVNYFVPVSLNKNRRAYGIFDFYYLIVKFKIKIFKIFDKNFI